MTFTPSFAALIALMALVPPVLAQDKPTRDIAVSTSPGKGTVAEVIRASAVIQAVDVEKRHVTIKDAQGKVIPLAYGPEARNIGQLKPGDKVNVRYTQALTLTLMKDGKELRSNVETVTGDRSAAGQLPGGSVGQKAEITADVIAVNRKSHVITLRGPERTVELRVRDPDQLKLINKGDQVHAVFTEAVALSVEPSGK